jgi:hypothetical protein
MAHLADRRLSALTESLGWPQLIWESPFDSLSSAIALDTFLLSAFATAWALHKRAVHEINAPQFEFVKASKRGSPIENAWLRIASKQAMIMASLGDRLGLDPKSRAALKLPDTTRRSKFDGLLGAQSSTTARN